MPHVTWEESVVTIAPPLLDDTYAQLRWCGQRRRECQLYWVSSWRNPHRITRVVHPVHAATMVSVEIDGAWLNGFFLELVKRSECIRVQVHSHPGDAFHSETDDRWPALNVPGFLSLVIPNFAAGAVGLTGAYLAEQDAIGAWKQSSPRARIRIEAGTT